MASGIGTYVILLRAIGPVTHKLMSMAAWREAAAAAGFLAPETLVNTGNMIAGHTGDAVDVAEAMEPVLRGFGLGANVVPIVRDAGDLDRLVLADPISEAGAQRPADVAVFFPVKRDPDFGWLADHDGPEITRIIGSDLVVEFSADPLLAGRLIRRIDKYCGTNTARNWNSVRRITERCRAREKA